jgi:hypothetical protein
VPSSFELDTRLGMRVRGPLLAGFVLGWTTSDQADFLVPAEGTRSDGTKTRFQYHLRNAKVDVFPLYPQLYVTQEWGLVATAVGVGGGYQLAFVEAEAFQTQILGGWGGTLWAGGYYDIRPDNPVVFAGLGIEAAYNLGNVRRNTLDRALSIPVRQELDTAGWSVRFTARLAWRGARAPAEAAR